MNAAVLIMIALLCGLALTIYGAMGLGLFKRRREAVPNISYEDSISRRELNSLIAGMIGSYDAFLTVLHTYAHRLTSHSETVDTFRSSVEQMKTELRDHRNSMTAACALKWEVDKIQAVNIRYRTTVSEFCGEVGLPKPAWDAK